MKLLFASTNRGKFEEIKPLVTSYGYELLFSEQTLSSIPQVEEKGLSFLENALLKARQFSQVTELPVLADDSGLEVRALGGAPGIFSARYAGKGASDKDNIQKLLLNLEAIPDGQRQARFVSALVFLKGPTDTLPVIGQGVWEGTILFSPTGPSGFGYDPIFYSGNHRCSAAQLPLELKSRVSHRGQAWQALIQDLRKREHHE